MNRTVRISEWTPFVLRLLAVALAALAWTAAHAQSYPAGPVRVIVPFPPGGGVDTMGRLITQRLSDSLGKPFPVENRSGANGNIGTEIAAKAQKDGTTLLFTGAGLVTNPSLYKRTGYHPVKDFEPVSLIALAPNVLVVHPSLPVRSVRDLVALARSHPGEVLFAGSGSGSTPHLAGELFNSLAGVKMVHVPYRGSGPAIVGLLSGESSVMFLPATNAVTLVRAGKLRAIAVTTTERIAAVPDLPTISESGLKGYQSSQWYGMLAPAGTPGGVVDLLNARIAQIIRNADMTNRLTNQGLVPVGSTREQFASHIRTEIDKWAKVIKASGARVN